MVWVLFSWEEDKCRPIIVFDFLECSFDFFLRNKLKKKLLEVELSFKQASGL